MKVYFSATITDSTESRERYKKIIDLLKKSGHKVFEYEQDKLTPKDLANRSEESIQKAYKLLSDKLKGSDIYIADVTYQSVGIGYEISQAIMERKPVLVLSHESAGETPMATIQGQNNKFINYAEYNNDTLEKITNGFIDEAKEKLDTKFILIISPDIDKYLKWASDEYRMHKAQIVRDAIEEAIKKDKDYKEYLKLVA